jgi:hypothetical protein
MEFVSADLRERVDERRYEWIVAGAKSREYLLIVGREINVSASRGFLESRSARKDPQSPVRLLLVLHRVTLTHPCVTVAKTSPIRRGPSRALTLNYAGTRSSWTKRFSIPGPERVCDPPFVTTDPPRFAVVTIGIPRF